MPQVSPPMAPPQWYYPQIPPPYFHQYPPANSPSVGSNKSLLVRVFHRQMDMAERQEKHDQEREERKKVSARKNKNNQRRRKQTRGHALTGPSERSNILMVPTSTDVFHGCYKYTQCQIITTGIIVRNCYLTVVAALPRQSTTSMLMPPQNK